MKQTFEICVEYRANDKGYTAEELLALLRESLGNEYDTVWHSVQATRVSQGTAPATPEPERAGDFLLRHADYEKWPREMGNSTIATLDSIRFDWRTVVKLMTEYRAAARPAVPNDAEYWKQRATVAELKVLTFTEEIAKLRPAGSVGEGTIKSANMVWIQQEWRRWIATDEAKKSAGQIIENHAQGRRNDFGVEHIACMFAAFCLDRLRLENEVDNEFIG